jgi:UDP-3-O-[3-hydroxymyristoyl] glucosamine N-acyltransferase
MKKTLTLQQIAELTGATLKGNPSTVIHGVADLPSATSHDISFLANTRYLSALQTSQAAAVFIPPNIEFSQDKNYLLIENPSEAIEKVLSSLHTQDDLEISGFKGIHPTAVIHPSAKVSNTVTIGPHAVIDQHVTIEQGTFIGAGAYIGPHTTIGSDCLIHPRVTIREKCVLGNRVILQPGVVIGGCGFGYVMDKNGNHNKLTHYGNVILEDDVEIGANTTIDRARLKSTVIKKGTKIDNLVMVGHNVIVGSHNIIVAQTGIAGSTTTGHHVFIGGQVAIEGHITIEDLSKIAARSGVSKSLLKKGETWSGVPAQPIREHNKNVVLLRNIEKLEKDS